MANFSLTDVSIPDYLYDFYGPSATWFSIYVAVVSAFIILSNLFFIGLTMTSIPLRTTVANWFLIGLSVSDTLHCTAHLIDAWAMYTGSIDNRSLCKFSGIFVVATACSSFGFPPMIAADRYYKISAIPGSEHKFSITKLVFADHRTIPLIVGWFFIAFASNIPLVVDNDFGEDPSGFCGAKKFTSLLLFSVYLSTVIFVFFSGLLLTAFYYYHLAKWLKMNRYNSSTDSVNYTRAIMRLMKIVTLIPVFLATPVVILSSGQMLLPTLPMWINRLLIVPYFVSTAATPWLTLSLLKPFRRRLKQFLQMTKIVTIERMEMRLNSIIPSSRTNVQEIRIEQ